MYAGNLLGPPPADPNGLFADPKRNQEVKKILAAVFAIAMGVITSFLVFGGSIYLQNIPARKTLFSAGAPPGYLVDLTQDISSYFYGYYFFFAVAIVFASSLAAIGTKATAVGAIAITVVTAISFVFFAMFGYIYYGRAANTQGNAGNIADDWRKCCIAEFYNNPNNKCPNTFSYIIDSTTGDVTQVVSPVPCIKPYNALTTDALTGWDPGFIYFFATACLYVLGSGVIAICGLAQLDDENRLFNTLRYLVQGRVKGRDGSESHDYEEDHDYETVERYSNDHDYETVERYADGDSSVFGKSTRRR